MLSNKDPGGFLAPLRDYIGSLHAVPVPEHDHHSPAALVELVSRWDIAAQAHDCVKTALRALNDDGDRKSVGLGTSVSVRVDHGGRRRIKKKKKEHNKTY